MRQKNLKNTAILAIGGIILTLGLFYSFLTLQKVFAAGINNIQINLTNSLPSASGSISLSFEIIDAIPANGRVEIEFSNNFSGLDFTGATGTNLGTGPIFTVGDTATTLQITLGAGGALITNPVTASGFVLTNPNEEGIYLVQIRTYTDTGTLLGMGFNLVKIGSPVEIKSLIEESMVVSLDNGNKVFSPDPAVNLGQISDQTSSITVQTNANTNYLVVGELAGNKLTSNVSQILSQNSADDYFRIGHIELNLESGSGTTIGDNSIFTGSTTIFQKTEGVSTNGDIISINYDLNISYFKEPGIYTGSLLYTVYPTF